jgi:hypothetical protein
MGRGSEEEAIVIVKPVAEEPAVTLGRVKQRASDREVGVEGPTT